MTVVNVSDISAEIEWKEIKHIHLTIYPPNARIHVSAPIGMPEDAVRLFLITKLPWIKQDANMCREKITISKGIGID